MLLKKQKFKYIHNSDGSLKAQKNIPQIPWFHFGEDVVVYKARPIVRDKRSSEGVKITITAMHLLTRLPAAMRTAHLFKVVESAVVGSAAHNILVERKVKMPMSRYMKRLLE